MSKRLGGFPISTIHSTCDKYGLRDCHRLRRPLGNRSTVSFQGVATVSTAEVRGVLVEVFWDFVRFFKVLMACKSPNILISWGG